MDRGTKIYALTLVGLVAGLLVVFLYQPSIVRELNKELERDPQLAAYPYPFRVLRVEGQTAVMTTPRSSEMPVAIMITAIAPELENESPDSVVFQKVQQLLAVHQALARKIVVNNSTIEGVRWELDRDWLVEHGIQ